MTALKGRLLAVGDIHGRLDKLEALVNRVAPTPDDRVVFMGDYIDRGPDSAGVIDYLLRFGSRFPGTGTVFLRGNHEQLFLDYLADPCASFRPPELSRHRRLRDISARAVWELGESDRDNFLLNGGESTLASYRNRTFRPGELPAPSPGGAKALVPREHICFLTATVLWHEEAVARETPEGAATTRFLFVHAGIVPHVPLEAQDPLDLLWIREPFLRSNADFDGRIVVHGHTPNPRVPTGHSRRICVDSGVCLSGRVNRWSERTWGKLTCCNVLTREIVQV